MKRALALALLITSVLTSSATAKGSGEADISFLRSDRPGVVSEARSFQIDRPSGGARRSPGTWPIASSQSEGANLRLVPLVGQVSCGHDPAVPGGLTCVLPPPERPRISRARPRPRPPSPEEIGRILADRAIALAPKPELRLAPRRRGLTGLESYFWLARRPRPIQARATAGPVIVIAEARPVQFVWDFGEGNERVTRKSGRRWTRKRPGNITHTYEGKGRYALGVEVIWEARWRTAFGGWRPLGYFSTEDTRSYRVREMIPVLVKPR